MLDETSSHAGEAGLTHLSACNNNTPFLDVVKSNFTLSKFSLDVICNVRGFGTGTEDIASVSETPSYSSSSISAS